MVLNFGQLQDKVLGWLDEGPKEEADTGTLELVKEALNDANAMRASEYQWKFMKQEPPLTFTLVPGTRTYTLDATFHVAIYFWNQTWKRYLTEYPDSDIPTRDTAGGVLDDYFVSTPVYGGFVLRGQELTLLWEPTSADVIEYGFYRLPTEMDDDADVPDIPYPHSRVLIYDALLDMAVYNEDISSDKLKLWQQKQIRHADALLTAHGQESSQGAQSSYISYIPRD